MKYQTYIDLGFKRTDMNDSVIEKQTGYKGFYLSKKVNKTTSIEVYHDELDTPKMYVEKESGDTFHIFNLTFEAVVDIFRK
jgi:hypothetical protein